MSPSLSGRMKARRGEGAVKSFGVCGPAAVAAGARGRGALRGVEIGRRYGKAVGTRKAMTGDELWANVRIRGCGGRDKVGGWRN